MLRRDSCSADCSRRQKGWESGRAEGLRVENKGQGRIRGKGRGEWLCLCMASSALTCTIANNKAAGLVVLARGEKQAPDADKRVAVGKREGQGAEHERARMAQGPSHGGALTLATDRPQLRIHPAAKCGSPAASEAYKSCCVGSSSSVEVVVQRP